MILCLKSETLDILAEHGLKLERCPEDRSDIPIDYRYLDLLLRASEDPEGGPGDFASGVRVGPGVRLPRLPALYPCKEKKSGGFRNRWIHWTTQKNTAVMTLHGRQNYSSLEEHSDRVLEVMLDQAQRGQVLQFSEKRSGEEVS